MNKIGIFLGSFDPIHNGHIEIAKEAANHLDMVLLVPLHDAPHKSPLTQGEHRIKMCQLAADSFDKISVFTAIHEACVSGYSMDLIHKIQQEYPNDELYYIVGSDVFQHIQSWPSVHKLCDMVKFFVYIRDDIQPTITEADLLTTITYISLNLAPISSSEIKKNQAYNRLDSKVKDYIMLHRLYE